ncbi:hypothetical protein [Wolbachia endosymbiont of Pentidionis agamae]|uniref:hypothetical protein n=1 Tax=Wolbachia endosymbiont of Pentidionis agamae TaxID=3110435 RepID=UPI002FD6AFA0
MFFYLFLHILKFQIFLFYSNLSRRALQGAYFLPLVAGGICAALGLEVLPVVGLALVIGTNEVTQYQVLSSI